MMIAITLLVIATITATILLAGLACAAGKADARAENERERRLLWTPMLDRLDEWGDVLDAGSPLSMADTRDLLTYAKRLRARNAELVAEKIALEAVRDTPERRVPEPRVPA